MDYKDSTAKYFFQGKAYFCSLDLALDIIGGKWRMMVIYNLRNGALRSGELKTFLPKISNKMFAQIMHELEDAGIARRTVYPVVPPKVEYSLTPMGESILPIINSILQWGMAVGTGQIAAG